MGLVLHISSIYLGSPEHGEGATSLGEHEEGATNLGEHNAPALVGTACVDTALSPVDSLPTQGQHVSSSGLHKTPSATALMVDSGQP